MARLFFTASTEEQWRRVAGPWLREQARVAWKNPKPTVVLTPSRAESFYLRSRLVEEGANFLGLRFWTPSDARKYLLGELSPEMAAASQPELRLVARAVAENLQQKKAGTDEATLTSVAQEPGAFLRAYDLLLGAGWEPGRTGAAYGRALSREMEAELKKSGIATQAGIHSHLRQLASRRSEWLLANLLVVGFNATHWPLWDLLRAVISTAEEGVLALSKPDVFGEATDQLWVSSWEEALGVSSETPEDPLEETGPFTGLVESYEKGEVGDAGDADLNFLVAPDLAAQAKAVVLQALDYLKRDSCTRLGVVFPEANALALEVSSQLRRLGIPLDDGTGAIQPGIFERRSWQTWIAGQEEPSVSKLMAWVRACEAEGLSCGLEGLSARAVVDVLDHALGETLVDDLDFLALHLEESSRNAATGAVTDFLRKRIVLPKKASFTKFLALTREALSGPGWEEHHARMQVDPPGWLRDGDWKLSRRTFLGWLRESTDSRELTRGAEGNHFYGKVHLLIYAQMTGQTWSHLILTGLNEGVWPRIFEAEAFGSRHELAALNQEARALNEAGTMQGGQGAGHETVKQNRGHCLLPLEKLDFALRDLCAALEGTSCSVSLAAMTTEAGRGLLPSDFFNHVYQAKTGQVLDEDVFRALAHATQSWCREHGPLFRAQIASGNLSADIAATRMAYEERRNSSRPFGRYEFAYGEPPSEPIQLSCKTWEDAWNHPSSVWLERVVGVTSWPEGMLSWPRAIGTWVHRWMTLTLQECQKKGATAEFLTALQRTAEADVTQVRNRARAAGIELYPWWEQVWGRAAAITRGLGETLSPVLAERGWRSEYRIPNHLLAALPGVAERDFALSGRIDLLLMEPPFSRDEAESADLSGRTCWVIDFKTGAAQSLTRKKVEKGIGIQALLYALAVRTLGAGPVAISLHTPDAALKQQVELDDITTDAAIFRSLDTLHRAGIFGMRSDAQNEYGFSPAYPMATRFVPKSILEAKWNLVHGPGAAEEEDA